MFSSLKRVNSLAASSRHSAAVSWGEAQQAHSDQGPKPQGRKGRPARLNGSALVGPLHDLSAFPAEFGYGARVRNAKLLMQHVGTCYEFSLNLRQCQRTWRRLQALRPS